MKLKFLGTFAEFKQIVRIVSPGGLWVSGYHCEYYTRRGPIIRFRPSGNVTVHGVAGPASELFKKLSLLVSENTANYLGRFSKFH